jgi:predicted amidohydrolase YtcJ
VILSHNPLDVDPSLIGSIQVLRTYVAGAAVHGGGGGTLG